MDREYAGASSVANPLDSRIDNYVFTASARFAFRPRVTLSASLPYANQRISMDGFSSYEWDLSDLSFAVTYGLPLNFPVSRSVLRLTLGGSVPVSDGILNRLKDHVDFSSGVFELHAGTELSLPLARNTSFTAHTRVEHPTRFNSEDIRIGDYYTYGGMVTHTPRSFPVTLSTGILGITALRHEHRTFDDPGHIHNPLVSFDPNRDTGGNWVFLTNSVAMTLLSTSGISVGATLGIEFPLYSYVNGTQLTERYFVRSGLSGRCALF